MFERRKLVFSKLSEKNMKNIWNTFPGDSFEDYFRSKAVGVIV